MPGITREELRRLDTRLRGSLDATFEQARERAREYLVCRPGCTECCIGPFGITILDAWRLQEGWRELRSCDPGRAQAVLQRARSQAERFAPTLPGIEGAAVGADKCGECFFERWAEVPCPALDPASGTCDLYAHRPVSCRNFGPPVRIGAENLPPCRLCFVGAPADKIERSRVEPDRDGLEGALVSALAEDARAGQQDGDETLVAFALVQS